MTQHQQTTSRPILAATPVGAPVSNDLPGLQQSPPIPTVLGGAPGTLSVVPIDYDKAVEVEQRKLCDSVLTPAATRTRKLAYDIDENKTNRGMTMAEAIGTKSMRSLIIMFPMTQYL